MEDGGRRIYSAYVDGNTVRKAETVPDYRRNREEERRKREQRRHKEYVARRNREHAMRMNLGYVLFLAAAAMVTALVAVSYIRIQSDVSSRMKRIASLESQIVSLKADNDAALKRINAEVDLEQVKNTAINELGMIYAGEDQIVYYTVEDDDYMNQYGEIPKH